jgi:hypothetical protein
LFSVVTVEERQILLKVEIDDCAVGELGTRETVVNECDFEIREAEFQRILWVVGVGSRNARLGDAYVVFVQVAVL